MLAPLSPNVGTFIAAGQRFAVSILPTITAWKYIDFPGSISRFPAGRKVEDDRPFTTSQKELSLTITARYHGSTWIDSHWIVNSSITTAYNATARCPTTRHWRSAKAVEAANLHREVADSRNEAFLDPGLQFVCCGNSLIWKEFLMHGNCR